VLIGSSQLKHFLGIKIESGASFLHTWQAIFNKISDTNPFVLAVSGFTLVLLIVLLRWRPKWPGMLIAMIASSLFALLLSPEFHGIKVVGELPQQLPPLSLPDLSLTSIKTLGSGALAIAMLGLVEAVSIARSVASKSGQRIDGSQEFIGQGLANLFGSFFSSYASSGSFTRSGLNYTAGAITPMAAIFAAASLAIIVLLVAPLAAHLPIAAMSAVLLVVAYRLIDMHHIKTILTSSKRETAVLITTFLATLFVELEFAIYVGVMLSLVIYLMRTSQPKVVMVSPDARFGSRHMSEDPALTRCPQLQIIRIDGSLYFGAVDHVGEVLHGMAERYPQQKHLLIIGNAINFIDVAGAELLAHEATRRREIGGGLYLVKVKADVCSILKRGGFAGTIGDANMFQSKSDAIASIFGRLDRDVCRRCDKRIFKECAGV
jgi:sulfate permease, SulP family